MPKEPGNAQEELRIEKEASYIVSVINPKVPVPEGYPSTEQPPEYPESILVGLGQKRIIFHSQRTYGLLIIQMYR